MSRSTPHGFPTEGPLVRVLLGASAWLMAACAPSGADSVESSATTPDSPGWLAEESPAPQRAAEARSEQEQPVQRGVLELEPIDVSPPSHPLAEFDELALADLIRRRTADLGSVSIGQPNRGRLFNAEPMPTGPWWHIEEPEHAFGTRETIESIQKAIERVQSDHPGSPPLHIGHISRRVGGWLRPHRSHQSGRDVDLGYYYLDGPRWYAPAVAENLDRPRTWSLIMGLLAQGNVEYIFITRDVQALLLEYARSISVDEEWLAELFDAAPPPATNGLDRPRPPAKAGRSRPPPLLPQPLIRHRRGHHTHLHVRFFSDTACETGRRTFHLLRRFRKL